MIVYRIVNKITCEEYIGKTTRELSRRWLEHTQKQTDCVRLSRAIKKYGKQNFIVQELGKYTTLEDLNNAEEYFISFYNTLSPNGYNLITGGRSPEWSEESKNKVSITLKKRVELGIQPGLFKKGEQRSPATQFKSGDKTRLGTYHTEETKKKIHASGTLFKPGQSPANKGLKGFRDETGKLRFKRID